MEREGWLHLQRGMLCKAMELQTLTLGALRSKRTLLGTSQVTSG